MKKVFSLTVALILFIMLFATTLSTGLAAAEPDRKLKVAYTTMTFGAPYFVEVGNGIKEAGEELGWEVTLHDGKMDVATQIAALETYIAQDYDLIFLSAVDGAACAPLVKQAADKGIPTVTEATKVDGTAAHVGPGEWDMGYALGTGAGKWCQDNLQGDIKVTTFGVINDPYTLEREVAMRAGIEEVYQNGNVIYINEAGTIQGLTPEDGIKNMEGILQSNPDINVIMGCNDDSIMGAYEAAKTANMDLSKMCFGGVNAIAQAIDLIKSEKAANSGAYRITIDIIPFETGRICVDIGKRVLEGEEFTEPQLIPVKQVTWDTIDNY